MPHSTDVAGRSGSSAGSPLGADAPGVRDYGAIGDGRSIALVSKYGSLDWLCWPRPDSPSLFAALLDPAKGGSWSIRPVGEFRSSHRYLGETNVLETRFTAGGGALSLTDLMPVASEEDKGLFPENEVLRVARCERGEAELEMIFDPRPHYAEQRLELRDGKALGIRGQLGNGLLSLRSDAPLSIGNDGIVRARVRLRAGDTVAFSMTLSESAPAVLPPFGQRPTEAIERSEAWWNRWSQSIRYEGPYRDAVIRSALALKLLIFSPSGAVLAAATTSLPERVGGDLNWDYRYCWLRDSALTVRALYELGLVDEARSFVDWLLHATELSRPEVKILYDVYGRQPTSERELHHLSGYRGSRPIRVGNAADSQLQLDVYGEVIDAVSILTRRGHDLDRSTQRMLSDFGEYVCRNWERPDAGIWEIRGAPKHFTYSKVMCCVALDRLLQMHDDGFVQKIPADMFRKNHELLHRQIERRGWSETLQAYTQTFDGDELDASSLLFGWYGYAAPSSPRMRATYDAVRERLGAGRGLLYRNHDAPEGAFGICGFWGAEHLARGGGSLGEARAEMEGMIRHGNTLGLFAEEVDPETFDLLGNFPQAFTHVGLINAAISIDARMREASARDPAPAERVEHAAGAHA